MQVVIEKLLLETAIGLINEAVHAHPHNKIAEFINTVQKNVKTFVEHQPEVPKEEAPQDQK